jgi:hypothetical protein
MRVAVLAFVCAVSACVCAPAYGQSPSPDPAPAPAPPPVEPSEPVVEQPAPRHTSTQTHRTEKKRLKHPLTVRTVPLHPPLAEQGPYVQERATRPARLGKVSNAGFTNSGSSESSRVVLVLLLALGAATVLLIAVPERLLEVAAPQLAHRRVQLAAGGFAVLWALAIGILIPSLLH